MAINGNGGAILLKARELCEVILQQPEYQAIQQRFQTFQKDERVQAQFRHLSEKREQLEGKHQQGTAITQTEITEFERVRDAFVNDPVASGFLKAQEELHEIRRLVNAYMTNLFETGRVAEPEEILNASCGHQCGCHDHE